MQNKNNFFDITVKNLLLSKKVFTPNLTTKLSYEVAQKYVKKNSKVLDLGCGSGILGIMIKKKNKSIDIFSSDVDINAVENAKRNFKKNKIKADIRVSNLFQNWGSNKFDYIINDVSGISSAIAKKSSWFKKIVPCDTGVNGTNLSNKIIINSKKYLKKGGIVQMPLISLSNIGNTISLAKKYFSYVKVIKKVEWFFPKELTHLKKDMISLKKKKAIFFEEKFGQIICSTSIIICKGVK